MAPREGVSAAIIIILPPLSSSVPAMMMMRTSRRLLSTTRAAVRTDWTKAEITEIYRLPFTELLHRASTVHRQYFDPLEVQRCTLLSIKTGGCNEDCKYCAQSTRYKTFVKPEPMMSVDAVVSRKRIPPKPPISC